MVATVLVVLTTNAADSAAIADWLGPQLGDGEVVRAVGYYAAVSAIERGQRAIVVDLGVPDGRDDWRLAEFRHRTPGALVVVADATQLPMLAGATGADLAATSVAGLPPLRELLVTDEPVLRGQAGSRRNRR